jgi:hypothetical protein
MAKSRSTSASKVAKAKKSSTNKYKKTGLKTKEDVCKAVYKFMCEEHNCGMTEWTREDLGNALGFTNPRTEKFAHGLGMLMKKQGLATNGPKKGTMILSAKGIKQKPAESTPKTLGELHERFLLRLENKVACGKGKVRPLWKILVDRKSHTIAEICEKLGYGSTRSFMNSKIIGIMEKMELLTRTKQSVKMTDKAFPSKSAKKEADDSNEDVDDSDEETVDSDGEVVNL